jgi:uncharacterized protein (TIGR00251 family)
LTRTAGSRDGPGIPELPPWAKPAADGRRLTLTLHVQPGAAKNGPAGRHGDALKLRISAPAADNKANEALIDYLRSALRLPRAAVRIAQGAHSRRKTVEIDAQPDALAAQLRVWDAGSTS